MDKNFRTKYKKIFQSLSSTMIGKEKNIFIEVWRALQAEFNLFLLHPLWLMPGRHRSSRSRPIRPDRPASIAADSAAVVDADSSPTERRERRGRQLRRHVANCRRWQLSNGGLSLSLLCRRFRRWRGASEERWSKKRKDEPWGGEGGEFGDGGRRWAAGAEVEGRRRVICDSKRAIHLATCQHSIVGICLWNQSRRTHPLLDLVPPPPPTSSVKIGQMFRGKAWKRLRERSKVSIRIRILKLIQWFYVSYSPLIIILKLYKIEDNYNFILYYIK